MLDFEHPSHMVTQSTDEAQCCVTLEIQNLIII